MSFALRLALLACFVIVLGACGGSDSGGEATTTSGGATTAESGADGAAVFTSNCGGFHTLAAAGTSGRRGLTFTT